MILHPIIDLLKRIVVDLPDYVKPSGGGSSLPSWITSMQTGDIVFAEDSSSITIPYTGTKKPLLISAWAEVGLSINIADENNGMILSMLIAKPTIDVEQSFGLYYRYKHNTSGNMLAGSSLPSNSSIVASNGTYTPNANLTFRSHYVLNGESIPLTYKWLVLWGGY